MLEKLGKPRPEGGYGKNDSAITNPKLLRAMTTQSVGPFRVTGLAPAVTSLAAVFADVRVAHPNVYGALTSGSMKVCRYQLGSTTAISNHSWGTAIDFGLRGHGVDPRGDGKAYFGLALIAPIFNRHGWYWGAAFGTEDAMHFEAGRDLIDQWSRVLG
jgi:D-alanyl-D-alanine carboxypeptidase